MPGLSAFAVLVALAGVQEAHRPELELARHPLDPLTSSEYAAVVSKLKTGDFIGETGLYPLITLHEPSKAEIRAWRPGQPIPRRAFVVAKTRRLQFEGIVDLTADTVLSWRQLDGVETGFLMTEEWSIAVRLVLANSEVRAALEARGIASVRNVICVPNTVGSFGGPAGDGRRLVNVVCYRSTGSDNYWGRPIEGLVVVVDLRAGEVVRVLDSGVVPVPDGPVNLDAQSIGRLRDAPGPLLIAQPNGPGFEVDGRVVRWQKWEFHFRLDPRLGLVISTVRYRDGAGSRSVLYQGSLSELFVPYMDPAAGWYFKTYLDAGEYGIGKLAVPLEPAVDCPPNARFDGAVLADDWGEPYTIERASCLFERYAGDVVWRHSEAIHGTTEARRRTDLVLRSVSAIGNYDYIFDWVFRQDGSIKVDVGATGVPQVKAVPDRSAPTGGGGDTAYGHLVAPHTVAVNHDHFLSFRLDLDVDGHQNSFLLERFRTVRPGEASPRASLWTVDSEVLSGEQQARLRIDLERPALWRVFNPSVRGPVGYPVSYALKPNVNAVSMLAPDDPLRQRVGFSDFHLWVTPHDPRERYAAGTYPNQSTGGDGLAEWTQADRSIENADLVLWYTLGFHHVVRAEDWPVMPTTWSGFELRPFDFFERNPALDIPSPVADHDADAMRGEPTDTASTRRPPLPGA